MELQTTCGRVGLTQTVFDDVEERPVDGDFVLPDYLPEITAILKCRMRPVVQSHQISGDRVIADGTVYLQLLYLDEERRPRLMEKDAELFSRFNCAHGTEVTKLSFSPGELYAAPCAGGIEVRLSGEFSLLTAVPVTVCTIHRAELGEPRCSDRPRPSVILRLPETGEMLWDIAKACGTTCEEIMQANELTDDHLPEGKMLLIPSAR